MLEHYILDAEHHVVLEPDLLTWARFMEEHERRIVEQTETKLYWVSTVFLGLDHGWHSRRNLPVVFETMTFDLKHVVKEGLGDRLMRVREEADLPDWSFDRYCSWDDALTGHRSIVGRLHRIEAEAEKVAT